jgi:hypothetical protein
MNRREFLAAGAAAAPVVLAGPAAWGRGREPLALVTADKEAHVAAVGLVSGRIRRRIHTIEGPRSIQSGRGGAVVVAHATEGVVALLDGGSLRVRRVLRGFAEPRYTAIAPDGRHAFVTDSRAGEVAVVDLRRGRVVARLGVEGPARHLTLDRLGRTLWIGLGLSAAEIVIVDVSDPLHPRRRGRVRPPFLAHDVGFSPSGRRVWVTAGRERRIAVYERSGGRPLHVLGADAAPQHVTFGPALAYVASGDGASVHVHALDDHRLVRVARIPLGSYNVQRALGRVLTPSLAVGSLTVLDAHGRPIRRVRVARAAHDVCAVR